MERATFTLAVPDDPDMLGRLYTALNAQSDPPIAAAPSGQIVLKFESVTWETMLKSRVMQALETAIGPDWQTVAKTVR
jgi:hypothetical protein